MKNLYIQKSIAKVLIVSSLLVLFPQVSLAAGSKVMINPSPQVLNEGGEEVEYTLSLSEPIVAPPEFLDPTVSVSLTYANELDEGRLDISQTEFQFGQDEWFTQLNFFVSALDDPYLNTSDTVEIDFTVTSESEYYNGYSSSFVVQIEDDETEDYVYLDIESPLEDEVITSNSFEVSGYSIPEYEVTVFANEFELGTAIVGEDGGWSLEVENFDYSNGDYTLAATARESTHHAFMTNVTKIDVVNVENQSIVKTLDTRGNYWFSDVIYDPVRNYAYALGRNLVDNKNYVFAINGYTYAIENSFLLDNDLNGVTTYGLALADAPSYLYALHSLDVEGAQKYVSRTDFVLTQNFDITEFAATANSGIAVNNSLEEVWVRTETGVEIFNSDDMSHKRSIEFDEEAVSAGNIVFNADETLAYIPDSGLDVLHIVDTETLGYIDLLGLNSIKTVALTPDESKLFAISVDDSTIYTVDLEQNITIDSEVTNRPPESIGITQDGLKWIVGDNHNSGYIYFGDVATNSNVLTEFINLEGGSYTTVSSNFVTDKAVSSAINVSFNIPNLNRGAGGSSSGSKIAKIETQLTYEQEVAEVLQKKIIKENPNGITNKCEALVMMSRIFEWDLSEGEESLIQFTDVPEWCDKVVGYAISNEIVEGRTPTLLGMETPVTRDEIALMLYRELKKQNYKFLGSELVTFKDVLTPWSAEAIQVLAKEGIIKGFSDGSFGGSENIIKQDFGVMLLRLLNK